jgi:hypothetical protein
VPCWWRLPAHLLQGRGFSVPADLAVIDARHGPGAPAVVMPCREVTAKELVWYCRWEQ